MPIAANNVGGVSAAAGGRGRRESGGFLAIMVKGLSPEHVMHRAPPYRDGALGAAPPLLMPHLPHTSTAVLLLFGLRFRHLHRLRHFRWGFLQQKNKKKIVSFCFLFNFLIMYVMIKVRYMSIINSCWVRSDSCKNFLDGSVSVPTEREREVVGS